MKTINSFFWILLTCFSITFTGFLEAAKSIGIFTFKVYGATPWDPDTIKSGITGSEEAVIYMSKELADKGYEVIVFADPPQGSKYSEPGSNPRYVDVNYNDGKKLDIAISWRMPQAAPWLKERANLVYLWPHDTLGGRVSPGEINAFDDVLWISSWQREAWMQIEPGFGKFTTIFGNGIEPSQFQPITERKNPYSCIYGSNYARGLEILLEQWPEVKKKYPEATLDVYYGWQHWGLLSAEKEAKMRCQMRDLEKLGVKDHGLVGHEELNRAYEKASLWTYPCIAPETFCITALRAQLSGAMPVIIMGTALGETVRSGFICNKPDEYFNNLSQALDKASQITLDQRKSLGEFVKNEYTWEIIAQKWSNHFQKFFSKFSETK